MAAHPHLLSFWLQTHGSTEPIFFFWANTHGSTLHLLSSVSTLMVANPISFLLGPHSWQHTPSPFLWVHTHGSTLHLLSSGFTLMAAHSISFLLGPHSWQHTPSPFFWVHTYGSTIHLLSSGSTLMAAHSSSFWVNIRSSTPLLMPEWTRFLSCFCKLLLAIRWHKTQRSFSLPFHAYRAHRAVLCLSRYLSPLSFCLS